VLLVKLGVLFLHVVGYTGRVALTCCWLNWTCCSDVLLGDATLLLPRPFSLDHFDDYAKHFTVMNYVGEGKSLKHVRCEDFIPMFDRQNPGHTWAAVEVCANLFVFSARGYSWLLRVLQFLHKRRPISYRMMVKNLDDNRHFPGVIFSRLRCCSQTY